MPATPTIARVTLDTAIRKEFDYTIPAEFADAVQVGRRVKVPFATRELAYLKSVCLQFAAK